MRCDRPWVLKKTLQFFNSIFQAFSVLFCIIFLFLNPCIVWSELSFHAYCVSVVWFRRGLDWARVMRKAVRRPFVMMVAPCFDTASTCHAALPIVPLPWYSGGFSYCESMLCLPPLKIIKKRYRESTINNCHFWIAHLWGLGISSNDCAARQKSRFHGKYPLPFRCFIVLCFTTYFTWNNLRSHLNSWPYLGQYLGTVLQSSAYWVEKSTVFQELYIIVMNPL